MLEKKDYELCHYSNNGLEIYRMNNTFRDYDSFEMTYRNQAIAAKFSALLDRIKPDIIHIQHLLYLSMTIVEEAKKEISRLYLLCMITGSPAPRVSC